jgi:hypothetical protein
MLGELLVWLGVAAAACIAWTMYKNTDTFGQDQEAPRRQDD